MILIDLLQAGGFRLKQATLRRMQKAYFEILKAFIRHLDIPDEGNFIISGCTVVGDNITTGMMYIDGELCEFTETEGTADSLIKKNVVHTNLVFRTGASMPVFRETNAIVVEADGVALSAFTRIQTVKKLIWNNIEEKPNGIVIDPNYGTSDPDLIARIVALEARPVANVPIGLVAIWGFPEDEIPAGWVPHEPLGGRFPIGRTDEDADFDSTTGIGATGGSKTVTLGIPNLPPHNHSFGSSAAGDDGAGLIATGGDTVEGGGTFGMQNTGGGEAFSLMNPYRVVDFIRYVGTEA